jgi:Protein of unknown function (DUF3040)
MGIAYRQRRLLRRIDRALSRSDPELAAMLSMFSRLNASEGMPARGQLRTAAAPGWHLMPWPAACAMLGTWAGAGELPGEGALAAAARSRPGGWPA